MKICRVRFEDGHVEIIDEQTIVLARALETLAKDPAVAAEVKIMATQICFAAAARKAL